MKIDTVSPVVTPTISLVKTQNPVNTMALTNLKNAPSVPEALQSMFISGLGQRLQAEFHRANLQKTNRKKAKRNKIQQKEWIDYLFEEEDSDNSEDQEQGFSKLEFFSDHLYQGKINDCYLIAVLYAAIKNPNIGKAGLANMIEPLEVFTPTNSTQGEVYFALETYFEVVFPGFREFPVIVDPSHLSLSVQVKGGIGYRILERAFAQLSQRFSLSHGRNANNLDDTLSSLHGGGYPSIALYAITGILPRSYIRATDESESGFKKGLIQIIDTVKANPDQHILITRTGGKENEYADLEQRFPCWHIYNIELCPRTHHITVIDPNNTEKLRHKISVDELAQIFSEFVFANLS